MKDFIAECNVCGQHYENWTGSTPCCGSIAYIINEEGENTGSINLFASINGEDLKPTTIRFKPKGDE